MLLRQRTVIGTFLLVLFLAGTASVYAHAAPPLTIYFYRDRQAVPVTRPGSLRGDPQADAYQLLTELLAGPTPDEQASGLTSPLPHGTDLITVTVSGDRIVVGLRLPLEFLSAEFDPDRSDAIVEQVVKTVHPLGLHHVDIRTEDPGGALVPLSSFLPRPSVPVPTMPLNKDPLPERLGPVPEVAGQPPAFGQGQPQGALTGTSTWISAGHGWYWRDTLSRWTTQRGNNYGLVEDLSNAEAINYYLTRYLWNAGADVWLVRERS